MKHSPIDSKNFKKKKWKNSGNSEVNNDKYCNTIKDMEK